MAPSAMVCNPSSSSSHDLRTRGRLRSLFCVVEQITQPASPKVLGERWTERGDEVDYVLWPRPLCLAAFYFADMFVIRAAHLRCQLTKSEPGGFSMQFYECAECQYRDKRTPTLWEMIDRIGFGLWNEAVLAWFIDRNDFIGFLRHACVSASDS